MNLNYDPKILYTQFLKSVKGGFSESFRERYKANLIYLSFLNKNPFSDYTISDHSFIFTHTNASFIKFLKSIGWYVSPNFYTSFFSDLEQIGKSSIRYTDTVYEVNTHACSFISSIKPIYIPKSFVYFIKYAFNTEEELLVELDKHLFPKSPYNAKSFHRHFYIFLTLNLNKNKERSLMKLQKAFNNTIYNKIPDHAFISKSKEVLTQF